VRLQPQEDKAKKTPKIGADCAVLEKSTYAACNDGGREWGWQEEVPLLTYMFTTTAIGSS
jgi:hypothetical protein